MQWQERNICVFTITQSCPLTISLRIMNLLQVGEVEGRGSAREGRGSDLGFLRMDCRFSEDRSLGLCLHSY